MASEMERALDEILSGVHELLAKGPPKPGSPASAEFSSASPTDLSTEGPSSSALEIDSEEGAHIGAGFNTSFNASLNTNPDNSSLIALLAAIETDPQHPAQPVARRWLSRLLLMRALPLGNAFPGFADITVSPIMHRAAMRLAQTGARLVRCDAHQMIWDCGFSPAPALGRLAVTARRDQKAPDRLRSLPRIPERMPVALKSAGQINFTTSLAKETQVAVCDQDNSMGQASTIFWIEQGTFAPSWLCGFVMSAGRLVPLVNPRTQV
jgi:hypothetical protein